MRDIFKPCAREHLHCYLYKQQEFTSARDVLARKEQYACAFLAGYSQAPSTNKESAGGVIQYNVDTTTIFTNDDIELETNDFVIMNGVVYVVDNFMKDIGNDQLWYGGKPSKRTTIYLRK